MAFGNRLRLLLLGILSATGFAVLFSWSALNAAQGRSGALGQVALAMTNYPSLVGDAAAEAMARISGKEDYKHVSVPRPDLDSEGLAPLPSAAGEEVPGLLFEGDVAAADRGWRVLGGAFALAEGVENAAVLVDPDFTIRRVWRLNENAIGDAAAESDRKIVHGLQITRGGHLVLAFDHGASLQRIDACGRTEWVRQGIYHHAVTLDPDAEALWSLRQADAGATGYAPEKEAFVRHDLATGAELARITVGDVIEANPDSGLLTIGARDAAEVWSNTMDRVVDWSADPFHFNDIDPLPAALADAFPDFAAGDLLVSARTVNSVFVLDPATLEIKWHLTGETHRQHDPDWWPDGRIAIYDNRKGAGPSRILAVDPRTGQQQTVVEGADHDFYSRIRGKHMRTPRGHLAIASPQQGRAFELSDDGVVAQFHNLGPEGSGVNLALTEFLFIPEDGIDLEEKPCESS